MNLQPFYESEIFKCNNFTHDPKRRVIVQAFWVGPLVMAVEAGGVTAPSIYCGLFLSPVSSLLLSFIPLLKEQIFFFTHFIVKVRFMYSYCHVFFVASWIYFSLFIGFLIFNSQFSIPFLVKSWYVNVMPCNQGLIVITVLLQIY